jgi:hypothetical protein
MNVAPANYICRFAVTTTIFTAKSTAWVGRFTTLLERYRVLTSRKTQSFDESVVTD